MSAGARAVDGEPERPRIVPPDIGAAFPGWWARAGVLLVGVGLAAATVQGFWLVAAIALAGVAAISPHTLVAWALALYFGAVALVLPHDGWTWRFALLLLGLHLLHVLASFSLALPPGGRVALGVVAAPLRRLLVVQVPVQAFAVLVLATLAPGGDGPHLRPVAVVAGGALVVGVVLLVWRWRTPR
ncbi:hypothetical protein ACFT5B_09305 [Luteimicrobium sp. NPDC057192]|uniref:hypothetical protein n=1 Tax=Luteimicrobium sp. NPDC057192 TaxID=3346042 RepID=UPI0036434DBC